MGFCCQQQNPILSKNDKLSYLAPLPTEQLLVPIFLHNCSGNETASSFQKASNMKNRFSRFAAFLAATTIVSLGLGAQSASAQDIKNGEKLILQSSTICNDTIVSDYDVIDKDANMGILVVDLSAAPNGGVGLTVNANSEFDFNSIEIKTSGPISIPLPPGPVLLSFGSASQPNNFTEITPIDNSEIAIYRTSTSTVTLLDAATGSATYIAGSAPTAPSSIKDLQPLFPLANFSESIYSGDAVTPGQAFKANFDNLVSISTGKPIKNGNVTNYVYGAPTLLGSSTITDGSLSYMVPAPLSSVGNVVASFDDYGRLVLSATIEQDRFSEFFPYFVNFSPACASPDTPSELPKTGAADSLGLLTLGLGVVAAGVALYARKRAQA